MATYKTPGVYVEEIATLPPSVAEVSTAIPAFIGYTEKNPSGPNQPIRITSLLEYKELFGGPQKIPYEVSITNETVDPISPVALTYQMYYCIDLYFKNGGGPCYIVSTGDYSGGIVNTALKAGLDALKKKDEPTLILFTEAVNLDTASEYYALCNDVLAQCNELGDRFGIFDIVKDDTEAVAFRQNIRTETEFLKYGAAYTPYLETSITQAYSDSDVKITGKYLGGYQTDINGINVVHVGNGPNVHKVSITIADQAISFAIDGNILTINLPDGGAFPNAIKTAWDEWKKENDTLGYEISVAGDGSVKVTDTVTEEPTARGESTLQGLETANTAMYNNIRTALNAQKVTLPPAAAIAGVYATTDRNRGVWKAPANVSVVSVTKPTQDINDEMQDNLNIDVNAGKSVNAIRRFTGKGTLVWGARTLAGNDNEWRYISTRRLFNTIEESCKKSTEFAVFEPNDANTWLKVKSMINSYLYGLWQQGALAGATDKEAYFINIGLGKTMTAQDILEGRMIVEVGIAAVRPAEFIILRFSHKLQES